MKYKRYFPILIPIVIWLFSQVFLRKPEFWYIILVVETLILLGGVYFLLIKKVNNWFLYAVLPIIFVLSFSFYASVIVKTLFVQLIFLLIFLFLYIYFRELFIYSQSKNKKKISNIMLAGEVLSIFASLAVLYTLPAFFNWSLWKILLIIIPVIILLFWQFINIIEIKFKSIIFILLINSLIMVEVVYAVSLLPLNFNVLAFLGAIVYYLICIINYLYWQHHLTMKNIKAPLILSGVIIILLLLTSCWL